MGKKKVKNNITYYADLVNELDAKIYKTEEEKEMLNKLYGWHDKEWQNIVDKLEMSQQEGSLDS